MKKRIFKISAILIVGALISYMTFRIIKTANAKKEAAESINTLPDFEFYTLKNEPFTKGSLEDNKPVAVLLFNTECDHCHYEIQGILKNINSFRAMQTLMISGESADPIEKFVNMYKLADYPEIKVLRDKGGERLKRFGTESSPTVFIYDQSQRFSKKYVGETKPEAILKAGNVIP